MLNELIIKNIAIIEQLQVQVDSGLTVLTGETGAGKSIIIDALGLLQGRRASPALIRTGEEQASVEAIFSLSDCSSVVDCLSGMGIDLTEDLIIRRILSRSGKNRVYINGSIVTLAQLQQVVEPLLTIYGQHEQQFLQQPEKHLQLLDDYARLGSEVAGFYRLRQRWLALDVQLKELEEKERDRLQRLDLLYYQQKELQEAQLDVEEEGELLCEQKRLVHAGELQTVTEAGYERLYARDGALCEQLSGLIEELSRLEEVEPDIAPWLEVLRETLFKVEDVAGQLRAYAGSISFDPQQLLVVEDRLNLLKSLQKKYAPSVAELITFLADIEVETGQLENLETTRHGLQEQRQDLWDQLLAKGLQLSNKRRVAAAELEESVDRELAGLEMSNARFLVRFSPLEEPLDTGMERISFFLAPNPGEDAKPLAKVASGGELSRIMLAIRAATPTCSLSVTQIFDEVDAGIGGIAATAVGKRLKIASEGNQVLCITHLPQVAAFASHHLRVIKKEVAGRTLTQLQVLDGENRVVEMARMLGGAHVDESTLAHSRQLLAASVVTI